MRSAVVGLVGEGEEGKRNGKGVSCLRVAGADQLCADVESIGQVQLLLLFTSLWHWLRLIGVSGPVA